MTQFNYLAWPRRSRTPALLEQAAEKPSGRARIVLQTPKFRDAATNDPGPK